MGIHAAERAGGSDLLGSIRRTYDALPDAALHARDPDPLQCGHELPPARELLPLLDMKDDSIDGIYDTLKSCARISKNAGGVGLSITRIRAAGSRIGNGGVERIVPMARLKCHAWYVDQAGRRKGSFALYLEPWHADVRTFLDLRKNHGNEELRCRDLFTAL